MIGWINNGKLNGDYFFIYKLRKSDIPLDYYLDIIKLDNYWVYKRTDRFRRVEVEEIGKYAGYIFFKKDIYYKKHIDLWIDYIKNINITFKFLDKPFPRIEILEKIEVV